ncbi:MAG: MBL fold metallo-hydrolase [Candidatus Roizmanbacteria bacterium]|nr:MBL fold metallo-hydrolase [Candidatus Roizmanbacteria bacterium]
MKINTYALGELQANCYLLEHEGEALIIDPADDASFLLEEVLRRNLKLVALLGTHGHFDHVMAVGEIQMSFNVPFYIHKKDQFLIDRLESTAEHFLGHKQIIIPPKFIEFAGSGDLQLSTFKCNILHTPGHTPGGLSFYFPEEKEVFTGDTLFAGAIGRTDLSYSSKKDLWNSLKLLLALPEETTINAGHGESSYIGQEKAILG